jgi:hypothetical protein
MKSKLLLISLLMLSACIQRPVPSAEPFTATEADFDFYFSHQVINYLREEYSHEQYGVVSSNKEPFISDNNSCAQAAFSGKSFVFGTRTISDLDVLSQMNRDKTIYFFNIFMEFGRILTSGSGALAGSRSAVAISTGNTSNIDQISENRVSEQSIFEDQSVVTKIEQINELDEKRSECVKAKGWSYIEKKK